MTESQADRVGADLVEYLIVAAPSIDMCEPVAIALAGLVEQELIRILDVVVIARDDAGTATVHEIDALPGMAALGRVVARARGLLTAHDVELAATAVPAATVGIVIVTEDRWAEPLAQAARDVGGRIVGGERIQRARVELALGTRETGDV